MQVVKKAQQPAQKKEVPAASDAGKDQEHPEAPATSDAN